MDSGTKMSSLAVTSLDIFNTVVILINPIRSEIKSTKKKKKSRNMKNGVK